MAATVIIERHTGVATADGGTTKSDITSINTRSSQADVQKTTETTNPVPVPTGADNYAYWVSARLNITVAGGYGTIDNLRWFSDAVGAGTGITCSGADASTGANVGYRQATSAIVLNQTNHTGLDVAPVNVTTLTSGSPRALGGSQSTTTGRFGDLFVHQYAVANTAGPGASTSQTFSWRFDET